jgi:hypothetical protein
MSVEKNEEQHMADANDPGRAFLEALNAYVAFRLSEKGEPRPADKLEERLVKFVDLFGRLLRSHNGDPNSDAFKDLMAKMGAMKETRGPVGPKPKRKEA